MVTLSTEQLDVRLGRHLAVRGVDLTMAPGQLIGVIGPNGAGKSTLVRALLGLVKPAAGRALLDGVSSGQIRGLVEMRDVDAPAAAARLGELTAKLADELNRAHNANSSVPAPTTLTGRNVGQSLANALTGFTGTTTISAVNASGVIQASAQIVFSGGTMTINGAAADPTTFLSVLNAVPGLFMAVKIAGALYLAWMGFGLLRGAIKPAPASETPKVRIGGSPFAQGLVSTVLNPKVAIFFLAALPQFVGTGPDAPWQGMLLIAIVYWLAVLSFKFVLLVIWRAVRTAPPSPLDRRRSPRSRPRP